MCPSGYWSHDRGHDIYIKTVIEALRLYGVAKARYVDEKRGKKKNVFPIQPQLDESHPMGVMSNQNAWFGTQNVPFTHIFNTSPR